MKKTLHQKVSTQVQIQEASGNAVYEHTKNPAKVIGLHDASKLAYLDYIEGLDPSNVYDAKILHRIASGN